MKRTALALLSFFALAAFVVNPTVIRADGIQIGATLENFKLTGTDAKEHSFNDLKGKNGTVLVFLSAQCPVVKGYVSRIDTIAAEYKAKGINFVGINSNRRNFESLEWVTSDAAERYKFPVLLDTGNVLADKLGATVTPEVYYVDAKNVLLYHGAIDNDRSGKNITDTYLKAAFDSGLAAKAIERTETKAFGCSIKREGETETK